MFPIWAWLDISFGVALLFGVVWETDWILDKLVKGDPYDWARTKPRRDRWKHIAETLVGIGVAGELICLPFSLRESAQLNWLAHDARLETERLRTAQTQSNESIQVLQALMGMKSGDLSKSFPLGYSLAILSGTGQPVIPFVDPEGSSIVKDWSKFRFLDMNEAGLKIQLPDVVLSGTTIHMNENSVWVENLPITNGVQIPFSSTEPCSVSHADLTKYWNVNIFPHPDFVLFVGIVEIMKDRDVIALGIGRPGNRAP